MDSSSDPDDEVAIDPLPLPGIPIPPVLPAIMGRARRELLAESGRGLTWQGWLAAAIAAVVLIGTLKLAGAIWTSPPPRWVPALGPGVTVTGPEQVAPGQGSPGAVLAGVLAAVSSKDLAAACVYLDASGTRCKGQYSRVPRNELPYAVSVKVGYVAIDGARALVGFTGRLCFPGNTPECVTNADPAAIFSAGSTFTTLWAQATTPSLGGGYWLQPCFKTGGKWYLGSGPPSDSGYVRRFNAPLSRRDVSRIS
jgi:hypothetical protein